MTPPEAALWARLRPRKEGRPSFRRQHPVGPYILDFYCARLRFAVEIDGSVHATADQAAHDARRDHWLARERIEVFRISARDVLVDPEGVADVIWSTVLARTRAVGL